MGKGERGRGEGKWRLYGSLALCITSCSTIIFSVSLPSSLCCHLLRFIAQRVANCRLDLSSYLPPTVKWSCTFHKFHNLHSTSTSNCTFVCLIDLSDSICFSIYHEICVPCWYFLFPFSFSYLFFLFFVLFCFLFDCNSFCWQFFSLGLNQVSIWTGYTNEAWHFLSTFPLCLLEWVVMLNV